MRRPLAAAATLAAVLVLPAAAQAAGSAPPPTPTPTPTATPTPVPPAPPAPPRARASLSLKSSHTFRDGSSRVQVSGRAFRVNGTLRPYVAGQQIRVTVLRNGKAVRHLHPRLRRAPNRRSAVFRVSIKRRGTATYTVRAVHPGSPGQARARSNKVRVRVVGASMAFGHGGAAVRLLQRGLHRLHYVAPRSDVYDAATSRAVLAWRKVAGFPRTYSAGRSVLLGVLDGKGVWKVRHPHDGRHVETDISKQVLVLVDGRRVVRIEPTSSGKPSTPTVLGRFRVYLKQPGTNSHGMLDSNYFIRGYAIHGYPEVPTYNASHGCLRVPIPDARAIYDWLHIGDVVWVEP